MRRRTLLSQGAALLPVTLAGCLNSTNSAKSSTSHTTSSITTKSTTTAQAGSESLLLLNEDSMTHTIGVVVYPQSNTQSTLVNSTYKVPSQYILEFADILEHDQEYHIEATISQGKSVTDTLTSKGCEGDQYNPNGDRSIIIRLQDSKPDVEYKECDVQSPPKYTRSPADQYETSKTATETTTSTVTTSK